MRKIVYYVASSIDGFISGLDDNVSGFVSEGTGTQKYLNDLKSFDTVIMGRNTYEFGYKYGVRPGQPSPVYAHMKHYIFSNHLKFESAHDNVSVKNLNLEEIRKIKAEKGSDIYLCGGGQFAGWLLDNGQIDILKIKLNPLILGQGTKLFGNAQKEVQLDLVRTEGFDKGLQIMTFDVKY